MSNFAGNRNLTIEEVQKYSGWFEAGAALEKNEKDRADYLEGTSEAVTSDEDVLVSLCDRLDEAPAYIRGFSLGMAVRDIGVWPATGTVGWASEPPRSPSSRTSLARQKKNGAAGLTPTAPNSSTSNIGTI
jgi:hypothetical protein